MKLSCIFFGTILILILLITIVPFKIPQIEIMESRLTTTSKTIPITQSKKLNEDTSFGKRPKNVLLVAYWRTGSTYFGQLLGHYPKTYYTYEPIHTFSNKVKIILTQHVFFEASILYPNC